MSHKISLIFIEYFLSLLDRSCPRSHQLFHSVSLQNIRVACSSQLDDQQAFTGESTKCFLRCYLWIQNLHAVCTEANVRKEQTLRAASYKLRRPNWRPTAECDSAFSHTTPAVRVRLSAFCLTRNVLTQNQRRLRLAFIQSVLVPSPSWGARPAFCRCSEHYSLSFLERPPERSAEKAVVRRRRLCGHFMDMLLRQTFNWRRRCPDTSVRKTGKYELALS